ncbi:MAG TPA: sulfotransferase [Parafilimonas sp.]|nr:sulfotransferase [Parafilimonas sp.]
MPENKLPNAFIIGVQKAGTTTLHDWLIQHPEIYGLNEYKDVDFFANPERSEKARVLLYEAFKEHTNQPVIIHCYVNYLLYEIALLKIYEVCPNARLIVTLRNPVDRAFSAYSHFKKFSIETRGVQEALLYTPREDFVFSKSNSNFTYIEHGFYYKQLKKLFEIFPPQQVLILEFDDLKKQPEILLKEVYNFLEVTDNFYPKLIARNVTGQVKNQWMQKVLTSSSAFRRSLIKYTVGLGMSPEKRKLIRYKLIELNTKKLSRPQALPIETDRKIRSELTKLFLHDVIKLDELLGTQYKVKWFGDEVINEHNDRTYTM